MRIAPLFTSLCLMTVISACTAPQSTGEWAGDFRGGSTAMDLSSAHIRSDLSGIKRSAKEARKSGNLTKQQAKDLKREIETLENLEERYSRDGLSQQEAAELDFRSQVLKDKANGQTAPSAHDASTAL